MQNSVNAMYFLSSGPADPSIIICMGICTVIQPRPRDNKYTVINMISFHLCTFICRDKDLTDVNNALSDDEDKRALFKRTPLRRWIRIRLRRVLPKLVCHLVTTANGGNFKSIKCYLLKFKFI